ncbi:MAG: N-acetyltransferase [Alkalicoccus sp.]|nr:MAG: N-acetyltransferase [Alkalicoccus sp.]
MIPENVQDKFLEKAYSDENMPGRIERTSLFVAVDKEQIIGFANFFYKNHYEAELGALYVLPEAQGKKTGTKLLEAGLVEKQSLQEIHVEVERDNVTGTSFYEARGFKVLEEYEEELYGHKLQTKRMKLTVPG